ncbi:hypothetical protein ISN45_Aa05g010940 [Arabidopsis thaliana x Arabidopsis arenosa]|uniref:Uncharacterized protein n=1 Tax=Arabidopsis thaliana x Arabidopsis arenosa TaxID=1240361 RepID=A0A8T1ZJE9_9BRAS|nr:hypothetical protein ISN45_Aa05g010940 [Arabidopsis thaliana x Arabidopsis arenosa]
MSKTIKLKMLRISMNLEDTLHEILQITMPFVVVHEKQIQSLTSLGLLDQDRRNAGIVRLFGLPSELMSKGKHFILIRNPLKNTGLGELVSIYSDLCQMATPLSVISSDELQRDPETTLHGLCDDLKLVTLFSFAKFYFVIALKWFRHDKQLPFCGNAFSLMAEQIGLVVRLLFQKSRERNKVKIIECLVPSQICSNNGDVTT